MFVCKCTTHRSTCRHSLVSLGDFQMIAPHDFAGRHQSLQAPCRRRCGAEGPSKPRISRPFRLCRLLTSREIMVCFLFPPASYSTLLPHPALTALQCCAPLCDPFMEDVIPDSTTYIVARICGFRPQFKTQARPVRIRHAVEIEEDRCESCRRASSLSLLLWRLRRRFTSAEFVMEKDSGETKLFHRCSQLIARTLCRAASTSHLT